MQFTSQSFYADAVTLGAFSLNSSQVKRIDKSEPLTAGEESFALLSEELQKSTQLADSGYYIPYKSPGEEGAAAGSAANPRIGDLRVTFSIVKPTEISLMAQQVGNTFQPYQTKAGDPLDMLEIGTLSAQSMFAEAKASNNRLTWILRGVGFACMFFGVMLIGGPLGAVANFLPIAGDLVRGGVFVLAIAIATPLTLGVIALAWLVYRPLLGIGLLAVGIGITVGIVYLVRSRSAGKAEPAK